MRGGGGWRGEEILGLTGTYLNTGGTQCATSHRPVEEAVPAHRSDTLKITFDLLIKFMFCNKKKGAADM